MKFYENLKKTMDEAFLDNLSKRLQIAKDRIMVEYYEMIILNKLAKSPFIKSMVFKGGTALKLAFGSPRFSEDLDFSLIKKIVFSQFKGEILSLTKEVTNISIGEFREKYYTLFALLKIKDRLLKQNFSIKVEVSKRVVDWQEKKDYLYAQFKSETIPLSPSCLVTTLQRSYKDKKQAIRERLKGRDYYDLWWLSQMLKKKIKPLKKKIDRKVIINELHIFLPRNYYQFLDQILDSYES